jgi:hypothetical protein
MSDDRTLLNVFLLRCGFRIDGGRVRALHESLDAMIQRTFIDQIGTRTVSLPRCLLRDGYGEINSGIGGSKSTRVICGRQRFLLVYLLLFLRGDPLAL